MPKKFRSLLVVLAFGWTGSASAALMPPVTVSGLDWLQPVDFTGYSWNDINTVCDATSGACNGSLAGNDLTGWTWASVDDVNGLFNHYIGYMALGPVPGSVFANGTTWLSAMRADGFLVTGTTFLPSGAHIEGFVRTLDVNGNPFLSSLGAAGSASFPLGLQVARNEYGTLKGNQSEQIGTYFVRDPNASAVPITNTMALMGLALCALRFASRKRTLNT